MSSGLPVGSSMRIVLRAMMRIVLEFVGREVDGRFFRVGESYCFFLSRATKICLFLENTLFSSVGRRVLAVKKDGNCGRGVEKMGLILNHEGHEEHGGQATG